MNSLTHQIYNIFRYACAMCFIGHGAFGIITKKIWCNYFAVAGINEHLAYQLMPVIGIIDILLGLSLIFYPTRAVAGWLILWGIATALMRPLAKESFAEFLERAGNYGAPFILILVTSNKQLVFKDWFKIINIDNIAAREDWKPIIKWLQTICFILLFGHAWLNLIGKPGLVKQYTSLGFNNPTQVALIVGALEMFGAVIIFVKPNKKIVVLFFIWKMASELFYPSYGLFEWIERGGSYGILLGLWLILEKVSQHQNASRSLLSEIDR